TAACQDLDSAVALGALLGGVVALGPFRGEAAGLDPISRDSSPHQRVTNIGDTSLAQGDVVVVGATEQIRGAVNPNANARVLVRIGCDIGDLDHLGRPNICLIEIEGDVP